MVDDKMSSDEAHHGFAEKLRAMYPSYTNTLAAKPGAVMVAVLAPGIAMTSELGAGNITFFLCKASKHAAALMEAYKKKCGETRDIVFHHNGSEVDPTTTVASLSLEGGDFICLFTSLFPDMHEQLAAPGTLTANAPLQNNTYIERATSSASSILPFNNDSTHNSLALPTTTIPDTLNPDADGIASRNHLGQIKNDIDNLSVSMKHYHSISPTPRTSAFAHPSNIATTPTAAYSSNSSTTNFAIQSPSKGTLSDTLLRNHLMNNKSTTIAPLPPHTFTEFAVGPNRHRHAAEHRQHNNDTEDMGHMNADRDVPPLGQNVSAERLVEAVGRGLTMLAAIEQFLNKMSWTETDQWVRAIKEVREQPVRPKTIIGVVGSTGAGKSSVINAMLEEERLVPTNCMRACTAVVTEISYSWDGNGYNAEIEFISQDDWIRQLTIMWQELFDGNGRISRDSADQESEAGVAYAQIKAVYPKFTKEDLERSSIDALMSHDNIKCLGTTKVINSNDPFMFYKQLQAYVDSKEKNQLKEKKKPKDKNESFQPELWPLIRVVRIYVKAHALSTGAIIVDLPGVHDSNQARAAVAQGYIKQCTGLWVVAPITRAVDDKSAKHLLGDTFKRQLKLDGGIANVTFICSKTDDISQAEAEESLDLDEEFTTMSQQIEDLEAKKEELQKHIQDHKDTRSDIGAAMKNLEKEIEVWKKLLKDLSAGKVVFHPKFGPQKRKRAQKSESSRKKAKRRQFDSDDDFSDSGSDSDSEGSDRETESDNLSRQSEPLTEVEINDTITELKSTKKNARRERINVGDKIQEMREQISQFEEAIAEVQTSMLAKCIVGRNEYSRGAIRQDYAAGIKELDQELAEEADASTFDPDHDSRDYEEVAKNLPVFCVSSRAYQKLQGRLVKDQLPAGFKSVEDTEIPLLQTHCVELTSAQRKKTSRRFLNNMFQTLNSLRLWAADDGPERNWTEDQLGHESSVLKDRLRRLDSSFENATSSFIERVSEDLNEKLFSHMLQAVDAAKARSSDTANSWGAEKSQGGLAWATYKAVCRREGQFKGSKGSHNFNSQLAEPIIQRIGTPWERVFTLRLPELLGSFPDTIGHILADFHESQVERALSNGGSITAFTTLHRQREAHQATMKDVVDQIAQLITERQRDAHREFEPQMKTAMLQAYQNCVEESGQGSFMRMKDHMMDHISRTKDTMFDSSVKHVQNIVHLLLKDVKEQLSAQLDRTYMAVEREYAPVVLGTPREQRATRQSILAALNEAEAVFTRSLHAEAEPKESEESMRGIATEMEDDVDMMDAQTRPVETEQSTGGGDTLMADASGIKPEDTEAAVKVEGTN